MASFVISKDRFNVNKGYSTIKFTVSIDDLSYQIRSTEITKNADWLNVSVTPMQDVALGVTVMIAENKSGHDRPSSIRFTNNDLTASVMIIQSGEEYNNLIINQTQFHVDEGENLCKFIVTIDGDNKELITATTYSTNVDWITVSGTIKHTLMALFMTAKVDENKGEKRNGTITFINGKSSVDVNVEQDAASLKLNIKRFSIPKLARNKYSDIIKRGT